MRTLVKRLQKELLFANSNPDESIKLFSNENNLTSWKALIKGPKDSPFDSYFFELEIRIPLEYPLIPPVIKFVSKIFHPNIHYESGEICLDILKKEWSPAWSLQSACRAILAILSDPAPDSPLNCDAGNMLRAGDKRAFYSVAKMYCVENCSPT